MSSELKKFEADFESTVWTIDMYIWVLFSMVGTYNADNHRVALRAVTTFTCNAKDPRPVINQQKQEPPSLYNGICCKKKKNS